jgi:tetratricopeptide (TPR) repeat protein
MTLDIGTREGHTAAYNQLLSRIVASFDPATKSVLYLASLLGPRLNDLAMYSLASLSMGQTMAGLAQLTDLRVLRDSTRGLEFVNELVRAYVYSSVPSTVRKALHGAIANRLLADEGTLAQSSGLEVAWHCLRAGRQEQALPHLLRGARQAMRQGAPHVAERALVSALPPLSESDTSQILLLLAEALQEQGRWRESIDYLNALAASKTTELDWRAVVLKAVARLNLGASLAQETRAELPLLTTILRESADGRTRVAAARVAAHFASADRDSSAAERLLPLVSKISSEDLDEDALGQLALTRGMLLWLTGRPNDSYDEVQSAVEALRRKGTGNIVAVQLAIGLGSLRMHQGRYSEALVHYHLALEMAARLGNDTLLAAVFGNLAICHGRLGNPIEQLRYSMDAPKPWGAEFGGFVEVQLTYSLALSLILLNRSDEAIASIAHLDRRLQGALPAWIAQAWLLWKADLLLCAGRTSDAQEAAKEAVFGFGTKLHSPAFAGPFARWLCHLTDLGLDPATSLGVMESLLAGVGTYDALDEVEVMCAALRSDAVHVDERERLESAIEERLSKMPQDVINHLRRLGSVA